MKGMQKTEDGGLVRKSDLAMRYFPLATSPKVARDNLTRWINRNTELYEALAHAHYNTHNWYFTPRQVKLIYEYLGEP